MRRLWKKSIALVLGTALAFGLAGCGNNGGVESSGATGNSSESSNSSAAESPKAEDGASSEAEDKLAPPNDGSDTLTIFGFASEWLPADKQDIEGIPFYEAWMEATGAKIDLTAISGDTSQQFNLMVAGGKENLADIICNVNMFEGGATAAYENGYIIDLTPYLDEYAPNYRKYLDEHPDIDKMIKNDDGRYLAFPLIRGDDAVCCFNGLIVRKDWLDEAGLDLPVTIDDWYEMLTVFKNDFGATAPYVMDATNRWHYNNFASAYGTMYDFFQIDGKVVYGPTQPGFKDFLAEMSKWYAEGLIDANYLQSTSDSRNAAISSGEAGALWGAVGGGIGKFMEALVDSGAQPEFEVIGVRTPVLNEGDKPMVGYKADNAGSNSGYAISTNCKNVELALKFLDYCYGEEGSILFNYGIEGTSFEMVDGEPVFTDLIVHNPDGYTMSQSMSYYIGASHLGGAGYQDVGYYTQYQWRPQQQAALEAWSDADSAAHLLPPYSMTAAESKEASDIDTEIWTLVDEAVSKIITGEWPVDDWDAIVEEVNSMDLDRSLEIKQAALERYNSK